MLFQLKSIGRKKPQQQSGDWLVREIDIDLASGERLALIGPTGAGKSVILRMMALLDEPDTGEVLWNGQPIANMDVPRFRRQAIYLHQRPYFADGTVEENLASPFKFRTPPMNRQTPKLPWQPMAASWSPGPA